LAQAILILFVVVSPLTGMAFYQGHTYGATEEQKKRILRRAVLVTLLILWFFTFLGDIILFLLQINVDYVRVTGGVYILVYAVKDVIFGEEPREVKEEKPKPPASGLPQEVVDRMAIVPLSIPLLAGPGAIATVMVLNQPIAGGIYCLNPGICIYGIIATAIAVAVVSSLTFILFSLSNRLVRLFNPSLLYTLGKVMDILVGAIAISFIIQGIAGTFHVVF
jgi:multiple antibiotic resistance protein